MRTILLFLAFSLALPALAGWQAVISPAGAIRIQAGEAAVGTLTPGLFEADWRYATMQPAGNSTVTEGVARGQIRAPGGGLVDVELRSTRVVDGLHLSYRLLPCADLKLNSLHVDLPISIGKVLGGSFTMDTITLPFPATFEKVGLHAALTTNLFLDFPDKSRLQFHFTTPTPVLVQDDRQWGGGFSLRIGPQYVTAPVWPAGKALELEITLTAPGGIAVGYDGPVTLAAGPEWIPLDAEQEIIAGSALDFTAITPWHAPAGKFGRITTDTTGHFAFTQHPTEPVRFYGVNLCFTGQYLAHAQADQLATRLQRLGYNAVRLHHYEGELVDRAAGNDVRLRPEQIDKLDYLVAALKQRGIYITTDLYVSRPVPASVIWDGAKGDVDMNEYKMAIPVNARAYQNYLSFARALLGHLNPYTGVTWAQDPALGWLSLSNEDNQGNYIGELSERVKPDWTQAWQRWRIVQQLPAAPLPTKLDDTTTGQQLSRFLADTEMTFLTRTATMLRDDLHCTALLTDCNSWVNPVQMQGVRRAFDYVDDHFYTAHPQFLEHAWNLPSRCDSDSPLTAGAVGGRQSAFIRLLEKPFTLTEYNYAAPFRYRGEGGIITGALAALQDWGGLWRLAYSHTQDNLFTPRPLGYFDLAADPLNQAADRAAILLFRRGDVRPAPHAVSLVFTSEVLHNAPARNVIPPWNNLAWITRVGTEVVPTGTVGKSDLPLPAFTTVDDPYAEKTGTRVLAEYQQRGWLKDAHSDLSAQRLTSETGEVRLDGPADTFVVDAPCTVGGCAPTGTTIVTRRVNIAIRDTPATVWVSSLDGKPLTASRRLLITHLTDLQNTGAQFGDQARTVLLAWGSLPYLVRAGKAEVDLFLEQKKVRVWGLSPGGRRLTEIPCRYEANVQGAYIGIPMDTNAEGHARMLYEVEVTP